MLNIIGYEHGVFRAVQRNDVTWDLMVNRGFKGAPPPSEPKSMGINSLFMAQVVCDEKTMLLLLRYLESGTRLLTEILPMIKDRFWETIELEQKRYLKEYQNEHEGD